MCYIQIWHSQVLTFLVIKKVIKILDKKPKESVQFWFNIKVTLYNEFNTALLDLKAVLCNITFRQERQKF